MIVKLKTYLSQLEDLEQARPECERRPVPSITELASEIGLSRIQLQRLASNQVEGIKFSIADSIIKAMRRRKFPMELTDLIDYVEE